MKIVISLCLILICFASAKNVSETIIVSHGPNSDDNNSSTTIVTPIKNSSQNVSDYYLADINEFPYHVAVVLIKTNEILCQGALISQEWFLTSATCICQNARILDSENVMAVIGERNLEDPKKNARKLKHFVLHPFFDKDIDYTLDLALWMLQSDGYTKNTEFVYLIDGSETRKLDCKYSSFIGQYLYGQSVKMQVDFEDCKQIGVIDDIYYCAVMNDTIHAKNKKYDMGSPLTCGGKLYAIRNANGYFTTVFDTPDWILRVMDAISVLTRKELENRSIGQLPNDINTEQPIIDIFNVLTIPGPIRFDQYYDIV